VAVPPPAGAIGPIEGRARSSDLNLPDLNVPDLNVPDLNLADWRAAEERRVRPPATSSGNAAGPPVDLSARGARAWDTRRPQPATSGPTREKRPWQARRGWVYFTRVWAVVKISISAASTWWTMHDLHAHLGAMVSAYGLICFYWAVGPHWRKRFFGPGQQLEPELYEDVVGWLWRAGTVLVLCGGVMYALHA
jgi:hypothetical protein